MPRAPHEAQAGRPSPRPAQPPSQPPAAQSPSPGPFAGHRCSLHPQRQAPSFSASDWGGGWAQGESHGAPGPAGLSFRTRRGCGPPPASPALGPGFGRRKKRGRPRPPTQARSSRNVCPRHLSEKTNFLSTLRSPSADQGTGECLSVSSLKSGPEQYKAPVTTSGQQPQRRCPQTRRRPGSGHTPVRLQGQNRSPDSSPLCAARRQDAVSSGWGWWGWEEARGASDECALLDGVRVRQMCSCAKVQ